MHPQDRLLKLQRYSMAGMHLLSLLTLPLSLCPFLPKDILDKILFPRLLQQSPRTWTAPEYIRSCYGREISFYTHADDTDLEPIAEAFEETSVSSFISQLQHERDAILEDDSLFQKIDAEPLVLVHEDFHAGNMLVRDGHLVGVLDWEFSGVYPLSELLGVAVILQISGPRRYGNEEWAEQEEVEWKGYYLGEVEHVARQRG